MNFPDLVKEELGTVRRRVKAFNSWHEAYGVLAEEVDEFWDEVKKKSSRRDKDNMLKELVQIASICQRAAEDLLS